MTTDSPGTVLKEWLRAYPALAMRTLLMLNRMLPKCDFDALGATDPFLAAGTTAAIAALIDMAVLGEPDADILDPPANVPKLTDRIWKNSVDTWLTLRGDSLSPAAIDAWIRGAVEEGPPLGV
jgi:hypothetical protein